MGGANRWARVAQSPTAVSIPGQSATLSATETASAARKAGFCRT